MAKVILILFAALTTGSLLMTYQGTGLQGIKTHSALKQVRSSHAGAWIGGSGGGFGSGK
jgi:hypothetical protein